MAKKNQDYIAAIDIGTTNCKIVIFHLDGTIAFSASHETPNIYNRLGPGWVEQDANLIWQMVCKTAKDALNRGAIDPQKIKGIGVTSFRQTVLAVDEKSNPIRLAIPWCIKATHRQAEWIKKNIGEEVIHRIAGVNTDPHWTMATFRYLIDEEPEIYEKSYKLVGIQDFVLKKLGVEEFVEDYSQASPISLLDLRTLEWSKEICDGLGLDMNKLPKVVRPGTVVGKISAEAALLTGFRAGTPLIPSGGDCQCSAIGCGVVSKGLGNVVIGTTAVGIIFVDEPVYDPNYQLVCHAHSIPDKFIVQHTVLTGGGAYRWFRDVFCEKDVEESRKQNISPYTFINKYVEQTPLGSNGLLFLPHFVGAASPYWNDKARGVFFGATQATAKEDFARSIIEGVCIEVAKGFSLAEKLGIDLEEVRLSGGVSQKGSPWNQIQADVYGKPALVNESGDTTALGAAILAGVAVGALDNMNSAVKKLVHFVEEVKPDMKNHEKYMELLKIHSKIYEGLLKEGVYDLHFETLEKFYGANRGNKDN